MRRNYCKHIAVLVVAFLLSPFYASGIIYEHGDVCYDGVINISDVTTLIDHLLSDRTNVVDDIDGDMQVNIDDVTALIDYLLMGDGEWKWAYAGPEFPDSALVFEVNGFKFAMMPVEGGEFEPDGGTHTYVQSVTLGDYYIGQTEVTVGLWEAVMGSYPESALMYRQSPWQPVDMSTWWECQDFIARLNELTGCEFHLATYDQWQYAAIGGKYTHGYTYAGSNDPDEVAWHKDDIPELYDVSRFLYITIPVGMKAPNELGLYDMSGNVSEWVHGDPDQGDYLFPLDDPQAELDQWLMCGSTRNTPEQCGVYMRRWLPPHDNHSLFTGLRLALGPDLSND